MERCILWGPNPHLPSPWQIDAGALVATYDFFDETEARFFGLTVAQTIEPGRSRLDLRKLGRRVRIRLTSPRPGHADSRDARHCVRVIDELYQARPAAVRRRGWAA